MTNEKMERHTGVNRSSAYKKRRRRKEEEEITFNKTCNISQSIHQISSRNRERNTNDSSANTLKNDKRRNWQLIENLGKCIIKIRYLLVGKTVEAWCLTPEIFQRRVGKGLELNLHQPSTPL
jgi:hypothetical protein